MSGGLGIDTVRVARGGRTILDDITLRLDEARVGVIGANGSGKSTLLRLFNGLLRPDAGRVLVAGIDVARDPRAARRRVGFVFQDPEAQIVMPTVGEEMGLGLKAIGVPRAQRPQVAAAALQRFGLSGREADSAHLLSGGEKQRLALACIHAMGPEILVMDEPTAMLDLPGRRHFRALLAELDQQVVIATHDLHMASDCTRLILLDGGRVQADGAPAEVIAAYEALVADREATP